MLNKKLLVICGPTASGKTDLAVKLAKKFNGELISADSRQVYQRMDIVTGKDRPKDVPVWGLDLVKPNQEFTVSHWVRFAKQVIEDIWQRGKLPIIVGGTGFWIKALIEGIDTLNVKPNHQLRQQLNNLTVQQLQKELKQIWPKRLASMNESDKYNSRRLIRAIEIAVYSNKTNLPNKPNQANYNFLTIGLKTDYKILYQKIDKRVNQRIKKGAQKEVERLIKKGYSWNLPAMTALGYREWRPFLEGKTDLGTVKKRWQYAEHGYARRQMTWFRKIKKIRWFEITQTDWQTRMVKLIKTWYYGNNKYLKNKHGGKSRNFL